MVEIVKCYRQDVPAMRFIGKCYGDEDRVGGGFGPQWDSAFTTGLFAPLEATVTEDFKGAYEDSDAYIGLMRWREGEPFQYWIGMFVPAGTAVPDGYGFVDFDAAYFGVCWLKGPEVELYGKDDIVNQRFQHDGLQVVTDKDGAYWFFERYGCPRFTTPDAEGHVILDHCYYVQ